MTDMSTGSPSTTYEPTAGNVIGSEDEAAELCALAPVGLLAELTHRCPLQCPYCSNPVELESVKNELTTEEWVLGHAPGGRMGILQIRHLSGGEPTARKTRRDRQGRGRCRSLYQPHHRRRGSERDRLETLQAWARSCPKSHSRTVDPAGADRIAPPGLPQRSSKPPAGLPSSACR